MLHTNEKIIKNKVGLLNLARELGNVARYSSDPDWRPDALVRSLKFDSNRGSYFSANFSSSGCSGLGFDFAIYTASAWIVGPTVRKGIRVGGVRSGLEFSELFVKQKQLAFRTLCGANQLTTAATMNAVV